MMTRTTAFALMLSMVAAPAFADCASHNKAKPDQNASTQIERPVTAPATNT